MKYMIGDIVLLYDDRTVYIIDLDKSQKTYTVTDADGNGNKAETIKESDVFMRVMRT